MVKNQRVGVHHAFLWVSLSKKGLGRQKSGKAGIEFLSTSYRKISGTCNGWEGYFRTRLKLQDLWIQENFPLKLAHSMPEEKEHA